MDMHFYLRRKVLFGVMIVFMFCLGLSSILAQLGDVSYAMSTEERLELKEEARDMFYHAYRAYMENAYPADELMPLSCGGRWRGTGPSRGDIDDTLGNFSLTLVDAMDTLVVLGDLEEFDHAAQLVVQDVNFDKDVIVSVFETNIRVLGGLLSSHILAEYLQQRAGIMQWYKGQLLDLAKDLGFRLLPAFNSTTGIPHARIMGTVRTFGVHLELNKDEIPKCGMNETLHAPLNLIDDVTNYDSGAEENPNVDYLPASRVNARINLRYGLKTAKLESSRETCTACAGTMILEMAALSRLTGEPIFEEKAHRAMDELWKLRHRSSDLMGTVLNIHSGDWVRRDSGVGAGIDSYYEYCLKAYILLGDERYLGRFNTHYSAVMKYISQGPMLLDVHMHRPHTNSRNFMDALLAFWPGLQVLKGDIKPAVETHEMLYQVMQRHNLIPEAFTTDFQVHWGQHPLRPEFLESTYFLYRATNDPYYLEVGKNVLRSLQKFARVPCGYAAVKDVRTGIHEDRMDSFVLAETFKYLYLLFADPSDLVLDLDEFLFTTEAHLLPLSLARNSNYSVVTISEQLEMKSEEEHEFARICPNTLHLFPESVRQPLRNMVDGVCPRRVMRRRLHAPDFQAGNPDHMKLVKDMGISILTLADGRLQLLHTVANAKSTADAEEGLLFIQEMIELSKSQAHQPDAPPQAVHFKTTNAAGAEQTVVINAGPAHFGQELRGNNKVTGRLTVADPLRACSDLINPERLKKRIVIMERGDCMFVDKARRIQKAGAIAGIVVDNTPGTSSATSPMFAMSGDGNNDVTIPVVFLFYQDASQLLQAVGQDPGKESEIAKYMSKAFSEKSSVDSTLERLKDSMQEILNRQGDVQTTVNKENTGNGEMTQMDVGDFHASVEFDHSNGMEMIRISRRDGSGSGSEGSTAPNGLQPPQSSTNTSPKQELLKLPKDLLSPGMLRLYLETLQKVRLLSGEDPAFHIQKLSELAQINPSASLGGPSLENGNEHKKDDVLIKVDTERSVDSIVPSDKAKKEEYTSDKNERTSMSSSRTRGENVVKNKVENGEENRSKSENEIKSHEEL
ncbi:Mannosyl-oligosaccharide alpha-1,2-mannosidase IA [Gryllus bimaculatus]|nr:Mannosyl-oligosaccharide alpha-1,2-mannosidase IA [Gryllus bimaculatus]